MSPFKVMKLNKYYLLIFAPFFVFSEIYAEHISLATTTSTENSGFLAYIIPIFEKQYDIKVRTIVQGTGQALETGRRGDADLLMVHAPNMEKKFVKNGYGLKRYPFMFNDFVIIGPKSDPGKLRNSVSSMHAFKTIYEKRLIFLSRGDDSGTHYKELQVWKKAMLMPTREDTWYLSTGSGMGATINTTVAKNGYTFTDRATWLSFKNKDTLEILLEGDPDLFNQYSLIPINKKLHPHVKSDKAHKLIEWLISDEGQNLIKDFKLNSQQLFFPNFNPREN